MKPLSILLAALVCVLSLSLANPALADRPAQNPAPATLQPPPLSQIVVELRDGEMIERINARYGTAVVRQIREASVYLLAHPSGASVSQMAQTIGGDPGVLYAEPNQAFKDFEVQQFSLAFDGQYSLAVPNDEAEAIYREQWAVHRTRLPEARTIASGRGATVAIVDTGVAMNHPALSGRFTVAKYDFVDDDGDPSDLPNGVDDDGDGYVDEATGHGTFLAGIVALVAPEASLMPVRALSSDGWGTVYDVAAAIRYAVDNGANVVNVSLGTNHSSRAIERAVDYARARNVVLVASVGNRMPEERTGGILYPARYAGAVAVVATDSDDMKASFSNWGKDADVSAPGATIYSTYWDGGYAWWSGTSMAAAFVSGGAALIKGHQPGWTGDQVASRLASAAVDIDGLNYSQYQGKLGAGRIDFYTALR